MLKSVIMLLAAGALFSNICAASKELLVDQENPKKWTGKVEFSAENARKFGPCFVLYGSYPTPLMYNDFIKINPDKRYIYKVKLRTLDPALPASGYIGFQLYDAKKRPLKFLHVVHVGLNLSEVISAKKGDKFMIVKMIPNFARIRNLRPAFHAKEDCSDIPNFDLASPCKKVEKTADGNLRLELAKPLAKDYPAGTSIRFHSPYGPPMYYLASGWMPAGEGKECVAILDGISDQPGATSKKFWKGTAYAKPFVWFGNYNRKPQKGAKLLVDGFSLIETDQPSVSDKK